MYPIKRTPEQGHTKKCLAAAMIAAIENVRDLELVTDTEFRGFMQENIALLEADNLLNAGATQCYCEPVGVSDDLMPLNYWEEGSSLT